MRNLHPGAVCVHMLCVLLPVVFGLNPITAGLSLLSGVGLLLLLREGKGWKEMLIFPAAALLSGIVNPLFNHNGKTVLFFLNRNPVTAESVLYGLVMGMLIAGMLAWGRCFTLVMDTDRLMTVTGMFGPKASLVLSMALRYIPLLRGQAERIREAQLGLGMIREDNGLDRLRGGLRAFDGLVTWGLENGITTADSMTARGYGSGRRTRYRLYPWERQDTVFTAASLCLLGAVLWAHFAGKIGYVWYPELKTPEVSALGVWAYLCFLALCLGGAGLEIRDRIRWQRRLARVAPSEDGDSAVPENKAERMES